MSGFVKRVLYGNLAVIGAAFVLGGIVILVVERIRPGPTMLDAMRIRERPQAVVMGCSQTLALVPGVSRSVGQSSAGMSSGVDRPAAAEFSFFLAMPVMIAAFAHDLLESTPQSRGRRASEIAVGFVMAFFRRRSSFDPF